MQPKLKKNIETDIIGDKVGRIHIGKQDLKDLQTRKMKGLKRGRNTDTEDEANMGDGMSVQDVEEDTYNTRSKRSRADP